MKPQFMIERQGKTFCLYAGLLDEAHGQGLNGIDTELLQIPTQENGNTAICRAIVTTDAGRFTGLGDASPANVSKAMLTCLIRMAETRAKARALRDAINVLVATLEELDAAGGGAAIDDEYPAGPSTSPAAAPARAKPAATKPTTVKPAQATGPDAMTPAQRTMLQALLERTNRTDSLDGLTRDAANQLISDLKFELAGGKS